MAKKQKRKLTRKQKLAGFGGKRAQSAARSRRSAPASRKTTKKTTKKTKKKSSGGGAGGYIAAGLGGLLAGGAAGYATHDAVQGLLQNLANGDIPVVSGLAGLIAGQGNGTQIPTTTYDLGIPSGRELVMHTPAQLLARNSPILAPGGAASAAIASGEAVPYTGSKDESGFPIGVYPMDTPFWEKQTELGTL